MFREVLQDLRTQTKREITFMRAWPLIYCTTMIPLIMGGQVFASGRNVMLYYGYLLPMLIGWVWARVCPVELSKTMLLCPIGAERRKQYIWTGYRIKVTGPILLFCLFTLIRLVVPVLRAQDLYKDFWYSLFQFITIIFWQIAINLYSRPLLDSDKSFERKYRLQGNYTLHEMFLIMGGVMSACILVLGEMDNEPINRTDIVILSVAVLVTVSLSVNMILRFGKQVMEQAVYFEMIPAIQVDKKKTGRF